ncbi:MAG TPA: MOSC domain-containing protein [Smithellaceae bacterium]|nr:MOSC domain-containing protein [Smithellaceae bacterium]
MGKILSVNLSDKKGEKKRNAGAARALVGRGLENDAHLDMTVRQISLLASESVEKIRQKGLPVEYGDFAENLTTEGIELFTLPLGARLKIGNDVLVEVSQIGKTCLAPCAIYHAVGDCVMPREGIFVRVLTEGDIRVGDSISVVS